MADSVVAQERRPGTRRCEQSDSPCLASQAAQQFSDDLQMLAHPVRLQILDVLLRREGHLCVCDLESAVPVKQPTISHHLKLLRDAGLVAFERRGLWVYYHVRRDALSALRARVASHLETLD